MPARITRPSQEPICFSKTRGEILDLLDPPDKSPPKGTTYFRVSPAASGENAATHQASLAHTAIKWRASRTPSRSRRLRILALGFAIDGIDERPRAHLRRLGLVLEHLESRFSADSAKGPLDFGGYFITPYFSESLLMLKHLTITSTPYVFAALAMRSCSEPRSTKSAP